MSNDVEKNLWIVVMCTMLMLLIVMFFCVRLIKNSLPEISQYFFIFSSDDVVERLVLTPQMRPPKLRVSPRWGKKHTVLLPLEEGLKESVHERLHINFQPNIVESSVNIAESTPFKDIPDKGYRIKNIQAKEAIAYEMPSLSQRQHFSEDISFKTISSHEESEQPLKVTFYTDTTKL